MPRSKHTQHMVPQHTVTHPQHTVTHPQHMVPQHTVTHPMQHTVTKPSIFASLKDGFGFGVGSAVAHRIVDTIMKPATPQIQTQNIAYEECLAQHADFIDSSSYCVGLLKAKDRTVGNK